MKKDLLTPLVLGLLLFLSAPMLAQNTIDFSFGQTGPNHSILVLPSVKFDGDTLAKGDRVGVFYTDNSGAYRCAGSLEWKANDFNMLPAWGANPPEADNGFEMGERISWFAQKADNKIYKIDVTYQKPLMAIYLKDGASAVFGMKLSEETEFQAEKPFSKN